LGNNVRESAKRFVGRLSRAPFVSRAFLRLTGPRRFLVLCYHRVNDDRHSLFGGTPVAHFRRQMEALRRHFSVLPLAELAALARARELPPNAVSVTFDDGYRDNFTHAFPVLVELGLRATIFLVTDAVDKNALIWHDRVFDALHRTRERTLSFDGASLALETPADRQRALARVLGVLRSSTPSDRDRSIESLIADLQVGPPPDGAWDKLRWDEVRRMAAGGIDFGAHTLDHPILKHVDVDEARRQIRGSKERIEHELGAPVTTFAYPNGRAIDFDESTRRILEEEGFSCAVTTVGGANDEATDPFALRRVGMWDDDPGLSILRLAWSRRT
jgi:peptidoglycan/xylan/chitin deacetylase (PgdA/CDA1 family)